VFISIAIYPAIRIYDEQAFDNMSEESEKNNFVIQKLLRPVTSQGMVEQAKKMASPDPSEVTQEPSLDPENEGVEDRLMKDIIK